MMRRALEERSGLIGWLLLAVSLVGVAVQIVWLLAVSDVAAADAVAGILIWVSITPVFAVPAALIISRQPGNRVGWLMMLVALAAGNPLSVILEHLPSPPTAISPGMFLLLWLDGQSWLWAIFPLFLIPLHFPTGRPPSPRWHWVNRLAIGLWLAFLLVSPFVDEIGPVNGGWGPLPNPIGFAPLAWLEGPFFGVWGAGLVTAVLASAVSLFVRYRRAQRKERQQIKWLLYAGVVFAISYTYQFVSIDPNASASDWDGIWLLGVVAIPVAITIAILRYQLWDIDLIIRKTLTYGALTGMLGLVYFGSVILLQTVVGRTANEQSPLIIVLSTLLIAALFASLRRRVQDVIDRRFYRSKYNAEQSLAQFSSFARNETDLDALTSEVIRVVEQSMRPEQVSLWFADPPQVKPETKAA